MLEYGSDVSFIGKATLHSMLRIQRALGESIAYHECGTGTVLDVGANIARHEKCLRKNVLPIISGYNREDQMKLADWNNSGTKVVIAD